MTGRHRAARRDDAAAGDGIACRICVSLAPSGWTALEESLTGLEHADLAEVRLDALEETVPDAPALRRLVEGSPVPLVLTCRPSYQGGRFAGSEEQRRGVLDDAAAAGPAYVDVELEADWAGAWIAHAPAPVVVSHHFEEPRPADLTQRADAARSTGAAVVKLVAPARALADSEPLLDTGVRLREAGGQAVVFCSGEAGRASRLLDAAHGAPWIYAASPAGAVTAPGQWTPEFLRRELRLHRWRPDVGLCGLIGDPIEHSLSPTIFNAAFEARELEMAYMPLPGRDVTDVLRAAEREGLVGLSVTMPFKGDAMEACSEVDPGAARIGAVNTLARTASGWVGHNTDGVAVVAALERTIPLLGRRVVVLGAGGAARAAAVALADVGARVTVLNRTPERAAAVAELVGGRSGGLEEFRDHGADVLVNATPVGMDGTGHTPVPTAWLEGNEVVLDMVYRPLETPLLQQARARGCETVSGLEMFLEQAARQFRLWCGVDAPLDVLRAAALERLEAASRKSPARHDSRSSDRSGERQGA